MTRIYAEVKEELFSLIKFYEERGLDWRLAAEFTLFKANGGDVQNIYYRAPWQRNGR